MIGGVGRGAPRKTWSGEVHACQIVDLCLETPFKFFSSNIYFIFKLKISLLLNYLFFFSRIMLAPPAMDRLSSYVP